MVLEQEASLYAKSFNHTIPIPGLAGLGIILESCMANREITTIIQTALSACKRAHFENIFGGMNSLHCPEVRHIFQITKLDIGKVQNRVEHKSTYATRVKELCSELEAVTEVNTTLTPARIVQTIAESYSLLLRM